MKTQVNFLHGLGVGKRFLNIRQSQTLQKERMNNPEWTNHQNLGLSENTINDNKLGGRDVKYI